MIGRDNVIDALFRSHSIRKVDGRRGLRRLLGNVTRFYRVHHRRKARRISLTSFLSRISLLASRSGSGRRRTGGIAVVAIRTTGNLRFQGIFIIKLRRSLFPSTVSGSGPETIRRRHHLFCITVAHTRRGYMLARTEDHCHGNRDAVYSPDHFLGSVSPGCVCASTSTIAAGNLLTAHHSSIFRRPGTVRKRTCISPITRTIKQRTHLAQVRATSLSSTPSSSSTPTLSNLRIKTGIQRSHFKRNRMATVRKRKNGTGTAISFTRFNRGRLLLGFTHLAVIRWVN